MWQFFKESRWPYFIFRPYFLLCILTSILLLPAIHTGFFLDDFIFIDKLNSSVSFNHLFNLYTFVNKSQAKEFIYNGILPWWLDEHYHVAFFRPLASLIFSIDFLLFGKQVIFYHLHALVWIFLIIYMWYKIFKLFLPNAANVFALIIFICSGVLAPPILWSANQHVLFATALISIGLLNHILYREQHLKNTRIISIVAFILGVLVSEAALSLLVYIFGYEFFIAKDKWQKRFFAISPVIILLLVYLCLYKVFHYGTSNSNYYLNPFETPLLYIHTVIMKLPHVVNQLYLGFNWPSYFFTNVLFCVVFFFILNKQIKKFSDKDRDVCYWLAASSIGALIPLLGVSIDPLTLFRIMLIPMLGASAVIAMFIMSLWQSTHVRKSHQNRFILCSKGIGVIVIITHLIILPIIMVIIPFEANKINQQVINEAVHVKLNSSCQYAVTIASPDSYSNYYIPYIRRYYNLFTPPYWYVLTENASTASMQLLHANNKSKFILKTEYDEKSSYKNEKLVQNKNLESGQKFETRIFTATVLKVKHQIPVEAQFVFTPDSVDKICWSTIAPVSNSSN